MWKHREDNVCCYFIESETAVTNPVPVLDNTVPSKNLSFSARLMEERLEVLCCTLFFILQLSPTLMQRANWVSITEHLGISKETSSSPPPDPPAWRSCTATPSSTCEPCAEVGAPPAPDPHTKHLSMPHSRQQKDAQAQAHRTVGTHLHWDLMLLLRNHRTVESQDGLGLKGP